MKKSALVAVGLIGTVAGLVAGCSSQSQTADCVDSTGQVLPDSYCQGYVSNNYYNHYYSGHYYHTHWIYGGHLTHVGSYSRVTGGSFAPAAGASVVTRSGFTISHGGFGRSGFGHSGGRG